MRWQIIHGDVRERLKDLEPGSVQCVVTSPPYYGLRDYGHFGQMGLESSHAAYVEELTHTLALAWSVLKDDGVLWLNLGDSYNSAASNQNGMGLGKYVRGGNRERGRSRRIDDTLKPKDLMGIPWRVAFALQAAGWYLRSDIIWSKPNPMPESVTDRPTKAHEYLFLLSKSARYYYNADAIKEPYVRLWDETNGGSLAPGNDRLTRAGRNDGNRSALTLPKYTGQARKDYDTANAQNPSDTKRRVMESMENGVGANKRSVWHIPTQPYPEAHFATFPEALVEPCVLAGSKEGDLILDPFCGSGTTGAVAIRLQRNFVGIELNASYVELARKRIGSVAPLLAEEIVA
jgi:DNA modification methylase